MCPQNPSRIPHLPSEGNQTGTRHTGNNPSHKLCVYVPACMSVYVSLAQSFSFCFSKQFYSVVQAGLEIRDLLSLPPECWD